MSSREIAVPRLIIYGVGQYGSLVARLAVQKGWPIVAAFNRAGAKIGQDLGRVIGLDRDLGVLVQDCETADFAILRGQANIGVVAQTNVLKINLPAYRRLFDAGVNILCHGSESYFPMGCDPKVADEIDALAKRNGVTFTGGGIWDMSRIWAGILVAGPCTALTSIFHSSITDVEGQCITAEQISQCGAGLTPEEFLSSPIMHSPLMMSYTSVPEHVLSALGYRISGKRTTIEPVIFDEPVHCKVIGTDIAAGLCVGTRVIGEVETEEGVTGRVEFEGRLFKPGEIEHMFWSVEGMPHTRVRTEREDSAHATAACLFNRIPDVLAAAPGIVVISQMGPLTPTALGHAA